MQVAGSMFPGPGLPRAGAAGYVLTKSSGTDFDVEWAAASGGGVSAAANKVVVSVGFDGQGSAIAANTYVDWRAPYSATIKKVSMVSVDGTTTTTVIGVWKDTWANWPPTVADKITGTAYPTITAGTKSEDSALTGWTTTVTAGDVIRFNVDSNSAALRIALFLEMEKT